MSTGTVLEKYEEEMSSEEVMGCSEEDVSIGIVLRKSEVAYFTETALGTIEEAVSIEEEVSAETVMG